jgi:hypothetical protein
MYGAVEAGRGPGKNDKLVSVACQPLADVNLFILKALTQSGTFFPIIVRFRARSAKTNNRKKGKYHAAAGKEQLEATSAQLVWLTQPCACDQAGTSLQYVVSSRVYSAPYWSNAGVAERITHATSYRAS